MKKPSAISAQTRNNWLLDASLFVGGVLTLLTGIYFLYLPTNGFAGGRNPAYNLHLLFARHTWDDLHTWGGTAMILAAALHLAWHWPWVVNVARRTWNELTGKCGCMNARGRWNPILNAVVAVSFLAAALSGIYFLLFPGERNAASATTILFSRSAWDLIHTWAGVIFSLAAILHFADHWKWVIKVTRKMTGLLSPARPPSQPFSTAGE